MHVAWVVKALQLTTDAGIDQSTSMIWQVQSKLPDIVKDMLKNKEYKKCEEFTKAVTELKGSRLVEKQEQHAKQAQELRALRADLARVQTGPAAQNPIKALQNQFSKVLLNLAAAPTTALSNNMYTRALQSLMVTEELKTKIRQLIQASLHHPDNAMGQAAYAAQLSQWNVTWGENTWVMQETEYPLKLDIAAIVSSECFACGTHGHNGRNCPLLVDHGEWLIHKELAWKAITSKVLGAHNRATATPIALVMNSEYEEMQAWIEEIPEQQGKADRSV
ncbi:uncharacterized protein EDB93DRAFT_1253417 [Suillus bovinus]|uniref:uncharacterized protein n=1 Tax=Suillus bovinus TaxID=48563 RepID=UPI001B8706EB|nr:uncharacterized protein EDB93DRAFT_1253417 [Suillus bovinus]KAG2138457.1 hypothetical protein EDB93DRAFT_1253417 [Suillus bovinus]